MNTSTEWIEGNWQKSAEIEKTDGKKGYKRSPKRFDLMRKVFLNGTKRKVITGLGVIDALDLIPKIIYDGGNRKWNTRS